MAVCAREGERVGYGRRIGEGVNGGSVTTGDGSVWRCAEVRSGVGGNASAERCWGERRRGLRGGWEW
jgi:hypothetical protein